jgi:hypothetical protein
MKHILGENLLRFGVKNLTESQRRSLLTELKDPVKTTANVKRDLKNGAGQVVKSVTGTEITCTYKVPEITTSVDPTTGAKTGTPTSIDKKISCFVYQENNAWRTGAVNVEYKSGTTSGDGSFSLMPNAAGVFSIYNAAPSALSYTGPGNKPVSAIKAVIDAVSKATGKTYSLDAAAETTLNSSFRNKYATTSEYTTDNSNKSFRNTKFTLYVYKDPETDKVIADSTRSLTGLNNIRLELPATGAYTVTGSELVYNGKSINNLAKELAAAPGNKIGTITGTNSGGTNYAQLKIDLQSVCDALVS